MPPPGRLRYVKVKVLFELAQELRNTKPWSCVWTVPITNPQLTHIYVKTIGRGDFQVFFPCLQSCCGPRRDLKKTPNTAPRLRGGNVQCHRHPIRRDTNPEAVISTGCKRWEPWEERGPLQGTALRSRLPWGGSLGKAGQRDGFHHSRPRTECRTAECWVSCTLAADHQPKGCGKKLWHEL